ncbi:unnamed protein product, partial [marine sediment metagenome]
GKIFYYDRFNIFFDEAAIIQSITVYICEEKRFTVSEIEDVLLDLDEYKTVDYEKAIQVLQGTLKVLTLDDFPIQYAVIQSNLGKAYDHLAELKDKAVNCEKAIQAYKEALKVYTLDDFPKKYAVIQGNLGFAYGHLAELKDKAVNCEKAIQAFKEALKVYTKEEFPEVYRIIEENIKNVYEL